MRQVRSDHHDVSVRGPRSSCCSFFELEARGRSEDRPLPELLWSPPPEAVDRTRAQQLVDGDDAVFLEHLAVLHHELHVTQRVDVGERISVYGDDVRIEAGLDRPALIL